MYKALEALQKRLGYQFKDQNLIIEALTHKSSKQPYNNERLEFLGDAVLDLIVGEYLYHEFKDVAEVAPWRACQIKRRTGNPDTRNCRTHGL